MRRLFLVLGALLVPMLSVFAQLPPSSPATHTGNITISGVDSLVALTQNIVTLYTLEGFAGNIAVTSTPNADAFTGLCTGNVDMVLSARLISGDEQNACVANAYNPVEFRVANDALIISVSPQNAFLTDLTTAELQSAFSTALNWSDVRATFPNEPINRYLPSADSGDFNFFVSAVFGGDASRPLSATNTSQNADGNVLLQNVSSDPNGIAIISASIANRNSSLMRSVPLDGNAPTTDAVSSGAYALSRPLVLYVAKETFSEKSQVADFLNYYLSNVDTEVTPLGLYPTSQANIAQAESNWFAATGQQAVPTAPVVASNTPTPTATPTGTLVATPQGSATAQPSLEANTLLLLIDERADLELLAANTLGVSRPAGWSGSLDTNNPQLALLIRLDLETLATALVGETSRPAGWFGAVPSTSYAIARDIRHDLELLADALLVNGRPEGWTGADPMLSCDRATQTLANLLERGGVFTLQVDKTAPDYCEQVAVKASVFTEVNLLNNPVGGSIFTADVKPVLAGALSIDTDFAVSFLDRGAALQVGVVPFGTSITAVARSFAQFSNMTLVQGENFLVFVDYSDTTLTENQFKDLPNSDDVTTAPFCNADWCGGE